VIKKMLRLVAAAAGNGEYASIRFVAQQIELIGLLQWLLLVGSIAAGTPLIAHYGRIRVAPLHLLAPHRFIGFTLPRQSFLRSGQRSLEDFRRYPIRGNGPNIAVSLRCRQKHAGRHRKQWRSFDDTAHRTLALRADGRRFRSISRGNPAASDVGAGMPADRELARAWRAPTRRARWAPALGIGSLSRSRRLYHGNAW